MNGRVIYSRKAQQDVRDIAKWIGHDNLAAAERVVDEIDRVLHLLLQQPEAGEDAARITPGTRRITSGSFVIYYRPHDGGIDVVRVVHGARDIGRVFE